MSAVDATRLEFLTTDGVLAVHFVPSLPAPAYQELLEVVKEMETKPALTAKLRELANRWGVAITID